MAIPADAGTNCWTQSEDLLVEELVKCPALLSFLGEGSAASAKLGNMFIDSIGAAVEEFTPEEWSALFPNVLIGSPGDDADVFTLTARSTGHDFGATGTIEVTFAIQLTDGEDETDQERSFKNNVGTILEELTDKDMAVPEISVQAYGRNPEDQHERMGVILSCMAQVRWGTPPDSGE